MTKYVAPAASVQQPSITPDEAGDIYCVRGSLTVPATLALNDVVQMVKLPADCVPTEFTLDFDALAASGLAMSIGFTDGTSGQTGAEFRAAGALANAAGIQRMDSNLVSRIASVSTGDRTVGVTVTTAGTTPAAGVLGFTMNYRPTRYGA